MRSAEKASASGILIHLLKGKLRHSSVSGIRVQGPINTKERQRSTVSNCAKIGLINGLARYAVVPLRDDLSFFFHFIDDPFGAHGNFSLIAVATSVTAGSCRFSGWSSKYCKAISTNCPTVTPAGIQLG